jgi:hypothetical protein
MPAESGYQQEQLGGGRVRFSVSPAPVPPMDGVPVATCAILLLAFVGVVRPGAGLLVWVLRAAVVASAAYGTQVLMNRWRQARTNRRRSPGGTFVVSASSIEAESGAVLPREQVRRLIVRNAFSNRIEPTIVDVGKVHAAGGTAPQNSRNDRARPRTRVSIISYMLCAEGGGFYMTLGGGMTEATAHGLLIDVSRILSLACSHSSTTSKLERPALRPWTSEQQRA